MLDVNARIPTYMTSVFSFVCKIFNAVFILTDKTYPTKMRYRKMFTKAKNVQKTKIVKFFLVNFRNLLEISSELY